MTLLSSLESLQVSQYCLRSFRLFEVLLCLGGADLERFFFDLTAFERLDDVAGLEVFLSPPPCLLFCRRLSLAGFARFLYLVGLLFLRLLVAFVSASAAFAFSIFPLTAFS